MYICLCKAVTEREVVQAVRQGAETLPALKNKTGVATGCGQCACDAEALLESVTPLPSDPADLG